MPTQETLQAQEPKSADPHGWIGTETVKTRFGNFEFKNGYPTPAAADALLDQLKFNRAIEVYLTQIPAVGIIAEHRGLRDFGAKRLQPGHHLGNAHGRRDASCSPRTPRRSTRWATWI